MNWIQGLKKGSLRERAKADGGIDENTGNIRKSWILANVDRLRNIRKKREWTDDEREFYMQLMAANTLEGFHKHGE